ncbi:MAG: hypothetical protein WA880_16630 [Ornithinimicrobium sp.]
MGEHVQPDLFGEYDQAQEQEARLRQPATCPSCGTEEPNGWLLTNNHGYDIDTEGISGFPAGQHPIYGAMCVAQSLVSSHIVYAVRNGDTEQLAERKERGRELGLDVEQITREAETDQ